MNFETNLNYEEYRITIDPIAFNRLLKTLKFTPKVFIKITPDQLKITAVDFKEYLGLIECNYKLDDTITVVPYEKDINLDLDLLIKSLDSFKESVILILNENEKYLTIKASEKNLTEKHVYLLPFEDGKKVSSILNMNLLSEDLVLAEFKVKADYLCKLLKHMTIIDSNIIFKFLKQSNNTYKVAFYAKKTNTIFEDLQEESVDAIYSAEVLSKSAIEEYKVYFNINYYLNILKLEDPKASFVLKFYNEYLAFEKIDSQNLTPNEFKYLLYIPIKT